MIKTIEDLIQQHQVSGFDTNTLALSSNKKWYRALSQRAGVCIILSEHPKLGPAMLMIQRAVHEGDPWSGQMAFPGGKHDEGDAHITATALRELREELGVNEGGLTRVARLSDVLARPYRPMKKPMIVTPLVFTSADIELSIKPNHEVADALWLPLSLFVEKNREQMSWNKNGRLLTLPCYHYQGKQIWGLSLLMIDDLLRRNR